MNPTRAHWLAVWSFARHKRRARNRMAPLLEANELTVQMLHFISSQGELDRKDMLAERWYFLSARWIRETPRGVPCFAKAMLDTAPLRLTPRPLP